MKSQAKSKKKSPKIMTVIIIIAIIGLGIKAVSFVSGYFGSEATQEATSTNADKATATSASLSGMQLGRELLDYQIVSENNLLRPLGWQKTIAKPQTYKPVVQQRQQYTPPESTNDLILTGIVSLSGEYTALMEDTSKGKAYFLKEGDKLKDYYVESITAENITLVNGNSILTPDLGSKAQYNSSGQILALGLARSQKPRDIAKNSNEKPASSGDDASSLSLIEQMKARRRRETGQE